MRRYNQLIGAVLFFLVGMGTAFGANESLDVTIKVLESPTATPDEVTRTIQLPPAASRKPEDTTAPVRDREDKGRDAGSDARGLDGGGARGGSPGRDPGGGIADDVRTQGERGKGKGKDKDRGRGRP